MARKQIATFLAPSKGLSILGSHCYAYSGIVSVDDTETFLLDFHSNKEYIVCKIQFNLPAITGDDYLYQVYFNGNVVQSYNSQEALGTGSKPSTVIRLVIPPLTHVQCSADNVADSSPNDNIVSLIGRVYV
jgi:hypothetical protein